MIEQILEQKEPPSQLYNLNIPTAALQRDEVGPPRVVPMGVARYGEEFLERRDPRGRRYFWATNDPPPPPGEEETDLTALRDGHLTLTPLHYDMTEARVLRQMREWRWQI